MVLCVKEGCCGDVGGEGRKKLWCVWRKKGVLVVWVTFILGVAVAYEVHVVCQHTSQVMNTMH